MSWCYHLVAKQENCSNKQRQGFRCSSYPFRWYYHLSYWCWHLQDRKDFFVSQKWSLIDGSSYTIRTKSFVTGSFPFVLLSIPNQFSIRVQKQPFSKVIDTNWLKMFKSQQAGCTSYTPRMIARKQISNQYIFQKDPSRFVTPVVVDLIWKQQNAELAWFAKSTLLSQFVPKDTVPWIVAAPPAAPPPLCPCLCCRKW